jgi:CRP-like cAMP-binding protein
MWLEQRKLNFAPVEVQQAAEQYTLLIGSSKISLNALKYTYYDYLSHNHSPYELVHHYLQLGKLISFRELFALLEILTDQNVILNPEWKQFINLSKVPTTQTTTLGLHIRNETKEKANPDLLKTLPFFRGLGSELQALFIKHTSIHSVKEGTKLCATGETSREMYVLLEGTIGVFKSLPNNQRQLLSSVAIGALVGEGGFLLGKPRSADLVTLAPTRVAVIQHSPEFDEVIASGKAEVLQRRFWVMNGLLSSVLFSRLPSETLDNLVFAGQLKEFKANTAVVQEGQPGHSFYIVVQGAISFTKGKELLRAVGQGGIFGEVALMVSGGIRTATATTTKDSLLLEIGQKEFFEVLAQNLNLAKILEELAWQRDSNTRHTATDL